MKIVFDGSNLCFLDSGHGPDPKLPFRVREKVLSQLGISAEHSLMIFDSGFLGWASSALRAKVQSGHSSGPVYVCPAGIEADHYILACARDTGAVVVSLDRFRDHHDRRVGVPLLKPGVVRSDLIIVPSVVRVHRRGGTTQTVPVQTVLTTTPRRTALPHPRPDTEDDQEWLTAAITTAIQDNGGEVAVDRLGLTLMSLEGASERISRVSPHKKRRIIRLIASRSDRFEITPGSPPIVRLRPAPTPPAIAQEARPPATHGSQETHARPSTHGSARSPADPESRSDRDTVTAALTRVLLRHAPLLGAHLPALLRSELGPSVEALDRVVPRGRGVLARLAAAFPDTLALDSDGHVSLVQVPPHLHAPGDRPADDRTSGPESALDERSEDAPLTTSEARALVLAGLSGLAAAHPAGIPRARLPFLLRQSIPRPRALDQLVAPGPGVLARLLEALGGHLSDDADGKVRLRTDGDVPAAEGGGTCAPEADGHVWTAPV